MFILDKFLKNTDYSLLPDEKSLNVMPSKKSKNKYDVLEPLPQSNKKSMPLSKKSKNKYNLSEPVLQNNKNKMDYNTFVSALKNNKNNQTNIFPNHNKKEIDENINFFLKKNFKGNNNDEIDLMRLILVFDPNTIFKIASTAYFGKIFFKINDIIDPILVDSKKQNFLYHIDCIITIIQILESDFVFNVNHTNINNSTFITHYATNNVISIKNMTKLLDCLAKRQYIFDNVDISGRSIFCLALNTTNHVNKLKLIVIIIQMPEINVLLETTWIKHFLKKINKSYSDNAMFNFILSCIINRNDYKAFLCELSKKYCHANAEQDLIIICYYLHDINNIKFKKMLTYTDFNGNTFIHYVSQMHFEQLLRIIYPIIRNCITLNNNNKMPSDLYNENKIENLFNCIQHKYHDMSFRL
jgi:hypothetical protein